MDSNKKLLGHFKDIMDTNKDKNKGQKTALESVLDSSLVLSNILDNKRLFFVLKKTEKITSALYLVLSFSGENDPLTKKLRLEGVLLLSRVAELSQGARSSAVQVLAGQIAKLTSLIEVARFSGLISEMNASVLIREYGLLHTLLVEGQTSFYEKSAQIKDLVKDNEESMHGAVNRTVQANTKTDVKRQEANKGQNIRHSDRQETILKLVREKGRVTVKDVADVIRECSEKTLQRELVSLVSSGKLRREGERRWSSYVVA